MPWNFKIRKVRDCMVPRTEIKAVEENCSLEELQQMFIESGNSKIVVYEGGYRSYKGLYSLFRDVPFSKELERPYPTNAVCARDDGCT